MVAPVEPEGEHRLVGQIAAKREHVLAAVGGALDALTAAEGAGEVTPGEFAGGVQAKIQLVGEAGALSEGHARYGEQRAKSAEALDGALRGGVRSAEDAQQCGVGAGTKRGFGAGHGRDSWSCKDKGPAQELGPLRG